MTQEKNNIGTQETQFSTDSEIYLNSKTRIHNILANKLTDYLKENNFDLLVRLEQKDTLYDFVSARAQSATNLYFSKLANEDTPEAAQEEAFERLFEGIKFSRREHLIALLALEFPNFYNNLTSENEDDTIDSLLKTCGDIYDQSFLNSENDSILDVIYSQVTEKIKGYVTPN